MFYLSPKQRTALSLLNSPLTGEGLKLLFSPNLPSDGSHEERHQGAEDVKEAIRQIGDGGHAEDGALRHAARVPRHKDAGDGGGVLAGATQQPRLVALLLIDILKHVGRQHDADELVARGDIQEQSRAHR